jgi:hypothetical protein
LYKLCDLGFVIEQMIRPDVPLSIEEWPDSPTPDEVQRFLEQDKLDPVSVVLQHFDEEDVPGHGLVANTYQPDEFISSIKLPPIESPVLPDLRAPTLPTDNLIDDSPASQPNSKPDWDRRESDERRGDDRRQGEERRYRKEVVAAAVPTQSDFKRGLYWGMCLGALLLAAFGAGVAWLALRMGWVLLG